MDKKVIACPHCGGLNRAPQARLAAREAPECGRCHAPLFDGRPYGGRYFVDACKAAFDRLYAESADGGRVFCMALHPYQIGQPHHIGHLR